MRVKWAYVVEIIAATSIYVLLLLWFSPDAISQFVVSTWGGWSMLCGVMFAAAIGLFAICAQLLTTEFGDYLTWRKADGIYRWAFGWSALIFFITTATLILASHARNLTLSNAALLLLLYSVANLYTLVKNAIDLLRLSLAFRQKVKAERLKSGAAASTQANGSGENDE